MRYTLLIAYDGLDYHGWQTQPDRSTIAATLSATFQSVFHKDVLIQGASRTDAGVHALGQVAQATTELEIDPLIIKKAWNARLPRDIHIRAAKHSPENFYPLANVRRKLYYYHFFLERPLPIVSRYGVLCKSPVDFDRLRKSLDIFVGTHDFRSFCTGDEQENTIRTIESIEIAYVKRIKAYRIIFAGHSFLRYMIRRIAGAALDCAMNPHILPIHLAQALEERNEQQHFTTAKPNGLLLRKIEYTDLLW